MTTYRNGTKMKKFIYITCVLLGIVGFVPPVNADETPGTWAVVDSTGLVTNIIVCTESVCGASGEWGGRMPNDTPCPGCRLVLQVPNSTSGYYNPAPRAGEPDRTVKYDEQKQVFTQGSSSAPIVVSRTEQEVTTDSTATLTATINSTSVSFGPSSYQNGVMTMTPTIDSTTGATLEVFQQSNFDSQDSTTATQYFSSPQTREQVSIAVADKPLISSRLMRFFALLREWMLD